jgi:DnaJ-class molecular chaperone
MKRDFYRILGVDPSATQEEIKSAYRKQAKRFHPDRYGEDCGPFREIQAAYEVLGNPERRKDYDQELAFRRRARERPAMRLRRRPVGQWGFPIGPFVSFQRLADFRDLLFDSSYRTRPYSFEDILDRLWNSFSGIPQPQALMSEDLNIDISLTPTQARRGGRVRVWIPAMIACPTCWGVGSIDYFDCQRCMGTGTVRKEFPVWIAFPKGVSDYHTLRVRLDQLGLGSLYLTVHFEITR